MAGGQDLSTSHRLTLDYQEDYLLIAAVFKALERSDGRAFSVSTIVDFLDAHPWVAGLNARFRGTGWIDHHRHELRTIGPVSEASSASFGWEAPR